MQALEGQTQASWRLAVKAAFHAFLLSRLIIFLVAATTVAFVQQWPAPGQESGQTKLDILKPDVLHALMAHVISNDAGWYASIAQSGYEARPFDTSQQANWAFFPLHPLLWRLLTATGISPALAGLLLANLLFFVGMVQLHRWMQLKAGASVADRATLCLAMFPTAYFFSLPWTESLFLFLSASILVGLQRGRWGAAALAGSLVTGTRAIGVLFAPLAWMMARQDARTGWVQRWIWPACYGLGLIVFMSILWHKTGNALAFSDIQITWGRGGGGGMTKELRRWLKDPSIVAHAWNVRWINYPSLLMALAATWALWRQRERALATFVLLSVLIPWASGSLMSMARYVMSCPPIFLVLGVWLAQPRTWATWMAVSACMLAWLTHYFVLGANFAGA
ncbi:mannosyltransferase family protein [Pseudoxanthomonas sp. JBR18]|uniref:mannosyltransferase family protein n=1 Tax=Pseudoxanthomonas sp. JBR18 TaxID=2969308 RepID=UPI002305E8DB|nr:mannosyltransferase family protein [Pseudoxanthomonas sp. JBR18]WCE03996.1 mannosyltransferase family protein [Pseudoxanthomonas sp. JBR18]